MASTTFPSQKPLKASSQRLAIASQLRTPEAHHRQGRRWPGALKAVILVNPDVLGGTIWLWLKIINPQNGWFSY